MPATAARSPCLKVPRPPPSGQAGACRQERPGGGRRGESSSGPAPDRQRAGLFPPSLSFILQAPARDEPPAAARADLNVAPGMVVAARLDVAVGTALPAPNVSGVTSLGHRVA